MTIHRAHLLCGASSEELLVLRKNCSLPGQKKRALVTAQGNWLILTEKAKQKHIFLLLRTDKESFLCWPPHEANDATFSLLKKKKAYCLGCPAK